MRPKMSSEPLLARVVDDIPPPHCNEDGNKTRLRLRQGEERSKGDFFLCLSLSDPDLSKGKSSSNHAMKQTYYVTVDTCMDRVLKKLLKLYFCHYFPGIDSTLLVSLLDWP